MKKVFVMMTHSICRLFAAALWQLVWLIPVGGSCVYAKFVLPNMIRAHFGVVKMQGEVVALDRIAELMKANASLKNPTALMHYVSAQLSKFSATAKLSTLEMTSNILETLCVWGLNILLFVAVVYAIIRTIRAYRRKTETYDTARAVVRQVQPELQQLHQEIAILRQEIQYLKQQPLPGQDEQKMISHD